MKAIIPVAGAGTKLRPHTYTQPKALIPLAGKTVLSIIVDQLHEAGIKEFIFIVGYLNDKIQDYVRQKYPELTAHFVHQTDRQGIGHAIKLARSIVNNEEVIVVLGDTICEYDVHEVINTPFSMLGVKKVDDPRDFGVAEINDEGFIDHVVEKPHIPKSNMALVGIYKIKESDLMFQCLESNALLLKKFGGKIEEGFHFENTVIIQPVSIGAGCNIKNSIIGPNVAVGESTTIDYSIIKNSIIGSYSNLFDIVLESSLIGSDTGIRGETRTLNIGDNTDIDLG